MQPTVTFITVVFNGEKELEPTILSIINQTYPHIEYVVIDGGSTDSTLDIIKKYRDKISYFISELDKGLYDAMNKGIKAATGDYFWFMNAGDLVYSSDTLEKIFANRNAFPDVIYGETEMIDKNGNSIGMRRLKAPETLSWKSLQWGMVVCHQSFIVKKDKCIPYDLHFRIASDINWMIEVLKRSEHIYNTHLILAKFRTSGLSYNNIPTSLKERFRIMKRNYGFTRTVFNHIIIGAKFFWYVLRHGRF
jgi:glycosyltransferase involved in cell wall biosynthesis